jgi:hypothetical protein
VRREERKSEEPSVRSAPYGRGAWRGVLFAVFFSFLLTGCSSKVVNLVAVRRHPELLPPCVDAFGRLDPTSATETSLKGLGLESRSASNLEKLATIQEEANRHPDPDLLRAFCEIGYYEAVRLEKSDPEYAGEIYIAILLNSWRYLFDPAFEGRRNPLDEKYQEMVSYHNKASERLLRNLFENLETNGEGTPTPGDDWAARINGRYWRIACVMGKSSWRADEIGDLRFSSDYKVEGLPARYAREGIGVPIIVTRRRCDRAEEDLYMTGLSYPMTLLLRPNPKGSWLSDEAEPNAPQIFLEFRDPLAEQAVDIGSSRIALAADLTTPLSYNYNDPYINKLETLGLTNPETFLEPAKGEEGERRLAGFYMISPYDPEKIPVILVHGLWSTPMTWIPMIGALQNDPEIWDRYQFWFWCYPTGYPWWVSAAGLRADLQRLYDRFDPAGTNPYLNDSVIIGYSMGGLIANLQVLESGDEIWKLVSSVPFDESNIADKDALRPIFFFHPNRRLTRLITIATPYKGSDSVNTFVKWFADKVITTPDDLYLMSRWLNAALSGGNKKNSILNVKNSVESMTPGSPFFEAMEKMQMPETVAFHNIVGVTETGLLIKKNEGDKIVRLESSRHPDAESEIAVESYHTYVHTNPVTVRETERILREHLAARENLLRLSLAAEKAPTPPQ